MMRAGAFAVGRDMLALDTQYSALINTNKGADAKTLAAGVRSCGTGSARNFWLNRWAQVATTPSCSRL
jgi:hypothetical protein